MVFQIAQGSSRRLVPARRRPGIAAKAWRRRRPSVETLDRRDVPAVLSVGPVMNVGHIDGSQSETAIAINPTNPNNIVALANDNTATGGEYESFSFDGGKTWNANIILSGAQGTLAASCCDGSLAFDSFGNLFMGYLDSSVNNWYVATSIDGGKTFALLTNGSAADQPKVATGAGNVPGSQSMWVEYLDSDGFIKAVGDQTTGLGQFGKPTAPMVIPGSISTTGDNFGKLSVGPLGQVLVTYQDNTGSGGPSTIFDSLNSGGVGGGFTSPSAVTTTNVGGFDFISPQLQRSVDAEAGPAYDNSNSVHRGRVYLVYTDAAAAGLGPGQAGPPTAAQNDTFIVMRYSDDDGTTWSSPTQINDDTTGLSHFFPRVAVDPTSGVVGFSWLDSRNDPSDVTMTPYATVSLDGGLTIQPNVQVWNSPSNASLASFNANDYGDYMGLSFYNGVLMPIWPDNSAALPGNTDRPNLDIATAQVTVTALTIKASAITATEVTPFSGKVGTLVSSSSGVPLSAFSASINWGDSTPATTGTLVANADGKTFTVTGTHTYLKGGTYTVTLSASQSGVSGPPSTTTATVVGQPIAAQAGAAIALNEGDSYSGTLITFTSTRPTRPWRR